MQNGYALVCTLFVCSSFELKVNAPSCITRLLLSCQPRVAVTTGFVNKVTCIRDLESIDHLFINHIRRIGLIHK